MFNTPHFVKALAALIVLAGSVALSTTAHAQTTNSQSQSDATDTNDAVDTDTSKDTTAQSELSDEEAELAELDALLLGPWVVLSEDATKTPSNEELEVSIGRCLEIPKFEQLRVEPAAEKALPDVKSLIGDLVYYRTSAGLQRIDLKSGQVVLFPEVKKVDKEPNKTFWAIRGETAGLALRFADTTNRGGQGLFMLENQRVYLKCGPGPSSDESSTDEKPAE